MALGTALKVGLALPIIGDSIKSVVALAIFYSARKKLDLPFGK